MHELEMKLQPICSVKEKLVSFVTSNIDDSCPEEIPAYGEIIDMIKDLAEVEEKCWKAKYYESIVCAMKDADEEEEMMARMALQGHETAGMMGYNPHRSSTTGRYTSGRGGRRGFRPMEHPMDDFMNPEMVDKNMMEIYGKGDSEWDEMRHAMPGKMGFTRTSPNGDRTEWNPRRGEAYNQYRSARRHYHETKSPEDKKAMDAHMSEHVMDSIASIREMWEDATPELRKRMKQDFTGLLNEMTV